MEIEPDPFLTRELSLLERIKRIDVMEQLPIRPHIHLHI